MKGTFNGVPVIVSVMLDWYCNTLFIRASIHIRDTVHHIMTCILVKKVSKMCNLIKSIFLEMQILIKKILLCKKYVHNKANRCIEIWTEKDATVVSCVKYSF